jgi:hypothetical protein
MKDDTETVQIVVRAILVHATIIRSGELKSRWTGTFDYRGRCYANMNGLSEGSSSSSWSRQKAFLPSP